jgi:hypothetical protein
VLGVAGGVIRCVLIWASTNSTIEVCKYKKMPSEIYEHRCSPTCSENYTVNADHHTYILLVGHELGERAEDGHLGLDVVVAGAVLPHADEAVPAGYRNTEAVNICSAIEVTEVLWPHRIIMNLL